MGSDADHLPTITGIPQRLASAMRSRLFSTILRTPEGPATSILKFVRSR